MPIFESPQVSNTRVTRSSTRRSCVVPEVPKVLNERPKRSTRREIILLDSDSEDEDVAGKNTYRNKKVGVLERKGLDLPKKDVRSTPKKVCDGGDAGEVSLNGKEARRKVFRDDDDDDETSKKTLDETSNDTLKTKLISNPNNSSKKSPEADPPAKPKSTVENDKLREIQNTQQISPTKPNGTPRKKKAEDTENIEAVTPPKLQKREGAENKLFSPSSLFSKLDLNSSPTKDAQNGAYYEPKKLFEQQPTNFQNARKALHSTVPVQMPGREKEHAELRSFIKGHLDNKTSGTLYVSGPPGTGKTASLSTILRQPDIESEFKEVYVNCTAIKSSGAIYSRIVKELNLKCYGKTEKDFVSSIESYLRKNHKMILLVLDEIDQLESKKQSVLYTIFEWPSWPDSRLILVGIANALDLTDRILPRLQARCELKPKLMHFAPYTKQQIVTIFTDRLREAGVLDMFAPVALQMLAGKVAAISGDVRRALDIGRRVVEIAEQKKKLETGNEAKCVDLKQVVGVLNSVYGTSNNLNEDGDDAFPLQQKIIICTLLLILKKARNKDVTVGKLHEVYKKVCSKRNLLAVDQAEFAGLCSLIETKGIIRVFGRKEPRLHKVNLEWDDEEVSAALRDKQLMSMILQDDSVLGKM